MVWGRHLRICCQLQLSNVLRFCRNEIIQIITLISRKYIVFQLTWSQREPLQYSSKQQIHGIQSTSACLLPSTATNQMNIRLSVDTESVIRRYHTCFRTLCTLGLGLPCGSPLRNSANDKWLKKTKQVCWHNLLAVYTVTRHLNNDIPILILVKLSEYILQCLLCRLRYIANQIH